MQSRRRFFCARVELVQLARAFLCPSSRHSIQPPTEPPQATPGRWTEGQSARATAPAQRRTGGQSRPGCKLYHIATPTAATEGAQSHATGQGVQASPETSHRAAHSGAQVQAIAQPHRGTEPPGNGNRRNPPVNAHRATQGGGAIPILPAAETPHSGAQSRPQRASRRGYRNAGEGKPTAATAPAHTRHSTPGEKSGGIL